MKIKIMQFINVLKETLIKIYTFFYQKIHGIDSNKIVFSSFGGKQYSDSGRIISEQLHSLNNKLKIVWLLNESAMNDKYGIIPEYVVKSKYSKINILRQISTAKVYISNCQFHNYYRNNKQLFIDTWHGDRGFKKILYEGHDKKTRTWRVYDNMNVNYCIAGSEFGKERYRKAFDFNGDIINEGMPRNDILINKNNRINEIKEKFGITNEKILLYAPTFRDNDYDYQKLDFDLKKVLFELSKDGYEWKVIIRSHVLSKGITTEFDEGKIINLTDYPDMTDILSITDFLITDYSSSAADFALTLKPIILLLFDYNEYKNNCRNFIADPKKVGFIYANSELELINIIKNTTYEEYKEACKKVNDYYKIHETGKSTNYICKIIMDFINK